jgi:hypothetical protein
MAGSGGNAVVATNADKAEAILGLGNRLDDTYATDTSVTTSTATSVAKTGGGRETVKAIGDSGSTLTLALVAGTDGNVQTVNNSASCTYTMPSGLTSSLGISFTLIVTNKGAFTATFTGVKWAAGSAPTLTSGDTKVDIFSFITTDGGTTWFGTVVQDVR